MWEEAPVFVVWYIVVCRCDMKAVWDYAVDLKQRDEQAEIDFEKSFIGHPMEKINEFSGFPRIREMESKYLPSEEVRRRYEESIGLKE